MASDGAPVSDDPVLAGALSELSSEGALDEPTADLDGASQPELDASAVSPAAPEPIAGDAAAVVVPDPLDGTQPFTYKASDGSDRTLEGVYRVPGEGLLVPEDRVAALQSLAERADTLDRVSRDYQTQNDAYARLSEWKTTGPDGKEQVLTGHQGIAALRTEHGKLSAAFQTVAGYLNDPQKFASLVGVTQDAQGNAVIVPNQDAIARLLTESDLAELRAEQTVRSQLASLLTPQPQPQAPNYAQHAPPLIDRAAGENAKHLSAEDRALLTQQLGRYVRTVTEEDRRVNPSLQLGGPIVDHAYTAMVQHLAKASAARAAASVAGEKAGKHNAGMDKGRQPTPQKAAPVAPKPAEPARGKKADWDSPLADALTELGVPSR